MAKPRAEDAHLWGLWVSKSHFLYKGDGGLYTVTTQWGARDCGITYSLVDVVEASSGQFRTVDEVRV